MYPFFVITLIEVYFANMRGCFRSSGFAGTDGFRFDNATTATTAAATRGGSACSGTGCGDFDRLDGVEINGVGFGGIELGGAIRAFFDVRESVGDRC